MTGPELRARVVAREPSAIGLLADRIRQNGGTYAQVFARVQFIFRRDGRTPPSLGEFDALLAESEENENGGTTP